MGRLEVKIYSASNLVPDNPYGCSDPECSITVERCTSTLSAPRAAAPKRKAVNPVWNQSLLFNVNERDAGNCMVHVAFFDTDDQGGKHPIGSCSISIDCLSQGIEKVHVQNLQNTAIGASVTVGLTALDFSSSYSSQSSYPSQQQQYTATTPQQGYGQQQSYSQGSTPYASQHYSQPGQSYSQSSQNASGYNSPAYGSQASVPSATQNNPINRGSPVVSSPGDFVYGGQSSSQASSQQNTGSTSSTPNDFVYGQYGGGSQSSQSSGGGDKTVFGVYGSTPTPSPGTSQPSSTYSSQAPSSFAAPPSPSHPRTSSGSGYHYPPSLAESYKANEPYKPASALPSLAESYKANEQYKPEPHRSLADSYKANEPYKPEPHRSALSDSYKANEPHRPTTPTPSPLANSGRGFPVPGGTLQKAKTVGPFALKKRTPEVGPRPLKEFQGSEVHRDFPHIARGSFGIVFKGKVDGFPETVVIKDMDIRDQKSVEDWKKEIHVMSQNLSNPYCAQVFGYASTGNTLTIVMEFFPKGDLFKVLHTEPDKHPLSLLARMRMARHVVLGISFLHENSFLHRDIKSMNLLVTNDYECKLTDFGTAKLSSDRTSHFNTVNTGTPLWMAPEVKQGFYSFSADVYSMGLVLYEIFERRVPVFDQQRQQVNLPAQFMSAPVVLPCIDRNPESRPKPRQVLSVVDNLIKTTVLEVKKLLPTATLEHIKYGDYGTDPTDGSYDGCDALDADLLAIYRYLMTMPPKEVDDLIEQAFHFQMTPASAETVDPSNPHSGQPPRSQTPTPQQQQPAPALQQSSPYPPMGAVPPTPYPSQHGLSQHGLSQHGSLHPYNMVPQPGFPPVGYPPQSAVPPSGVPLGYPGGLPPTNYPMGIGYTPPPPGFGYPPGY